MRRCGGLLKEDKKLEDKLSDREKAVAIKFAKNMEGTEIPLEASTHLLCALDSKRHIAMAKASIKLLVAHRANLDLLCKEQSPDGFPPLNNKGDKGGRGSRGGRGNMGGEGKASGKGKGGGKVRRQSAPPRPMTPLDRTITAPPPVFGPYAAPPPSTRARHATVVHNI